MTGASAGRGTDRRNARRRRLARRLLALALLLPPTLLGLAVTALEAASYLVDLPDDLLRTEPSLRLLDRQGRLLREVRTGTETRHRRIALEEVSPHLVPATLAAEDRRFFSHRGVDPWALGRALLQNLRAGRVVSGASTLTMQLARILRGGDRTAGNKFLEMALARRLERTFDKRRLLEEYLNRAPYGPDLVGVEAASWCWFRKSAADLSLGEAAALAAIPRSPTLYDPTRGTDRLRARRDRILERMRRFGFIDDRALRRARAEPVAVHPPLRRFEAPHFVQWVLGEGPADAIPPNGDIRTTLDLGLQRRVEVLAERTVSALRERGGRDAAVVVLDNRDGAVLAYLGSADFFDPRAGQVDGARALRQPGSALKPLTYALAFDAGLDPASVLPDLPARYDTAQGLPYEPRNYDLRFHGPVRAREALANSYNVPAVHLASILTPRRLLETYRDFGLGMLDRDPEYYGVALTLGDGEVTLLALANAYAALARGGLWRPVRWRLGGDDGASAERRVVSAEAAFWVTDILADKRARLAEFGEGSALELPFPAAAKTGTSKAYRDNWAVGYTREVTVAVWVGNFSGEPMGSVSGVSGAGPLFREVMLAAMLGRTPRPFDPPPSLRRASVCPLSGRPPGPDCPPAVDEWVRRAGDRPAPCDWHRRLEVDRIAGGRAGPGCPRSDVERRRFEVLPPEYRSWARQAGRPLPPDTRSPRCPDTPADGDHPAHPALRILSPSPGARYGLDPDTARHLQTLPVEAAFDGPPLPADWTAECRVDDRSLGARPAPFRWLWPLEVGRHRFEVRLSDPAGGPGWTASAEVEVH